MTVNACRAWALAACGLVGALQVSTAVAATNIAIAQEGLGIRVTWDGGPDTIVQIANNPSFTRPVCQSTTVSPSSPQVLDCRGVAFSGTAWVKVGIFATPVALSTAGMNFAPTPPGPDTVVDAVNRTPMACGVTQPQGWANTDGDTQYSATLTSKGVVIAEKALGNPLPNTHFGVSVLPRTIEYELAPRDTDGDVVCRVVAVNGVHSTIHTTTYHVGHTPPWAIEPGRILNELPLKQHIPRRVRKHAVSRAEAKRGLLARASMLYGVGVGTYDAQADLSYHATPARAKAATARWCRALRQVFHKPKLRLPKKVLSCVAVRRAKGMSSMYRGVLVETRMSEFGPYAVTSVVVGGSTGRYSFLVLGHAIGSGTAKRRQASKNASMVLAQMTDGIARE